MVVYRFGQEDLLRTRFAISPLMEISGSVEALRDPAAFAVHAPWAAWAGPRAAALEWDLLDACVPRDGRFYPDFVSPPPAVPSAQLDDELERVRRTAHDQVAAELRRAYPDGPLPPAARELVEAPERGLARLAAQMRAWFDALLAPHWDAVLALLEAEVAWRARRLAAVGPGAAFAGLAPDVRWVPGAVEVSSAGDRAVELGGRGLLLVPAAFAWPRVWPMSDPPWQPALVYAPAGVATLWEPPAAGTGALEALLGARRARILATLGHPASTQELARRLRASPGGVSEHLAVLRRAGLVTPRREGRLVLYVRTRAGDALVGAARGEARSAIGAGE